MKKLVYKNIILIIIFLVSPWFIYENFYQPGMPDKHVNSLIYFMLLGAVYLVYMNVKFSIRLKDSAQKVSIVFIIPPALILIYFILGYFAFSGFTGF
ncbi:hypothetical protein BK004_01940 [bacterium CG10_46_32]|nr:MAG: hypothetical protein BK004_01940 [bacterium CG10_46_32]PIR56196.1 MAG: hypothetical protein COU73_01965 [Parcubacteria group bacterium CG10_big_fil_rev_8_21_14_0_10_46_32]